MAVESPRVRIDHVIYGTSDLDAAQARFEAAGLEVTPGGAHEGIGTHNRIVPLGGDYIELLAILDPEMAAASELGRPIAERIARGDGWMAWGVAVEDVGAEAERLEVAGDRARLGVWLGGAELPVDIVAGAPALLAVTVRGRRL
jgi:hypothetical protein